jgi:hypothetical protein
LPWPRGRRRSGCLLHGSARSAVRRGGRDAARDAFSSDHSGQCCGQHSGQYCAELSRRAWLDVRRRGGKLAGTEPCEFIELWAASRHTHQGLETRPMRLRCLGMCRHAEHRGSALGIDSPRCCDGRRLHGDCLRLGRQSLDELARSSPALMDGHKLSSCTLRALYRGNRGRPFTRYSRHGILGHSAADPVPPAPAS